MFKRVIAFFITLFIAQLSFAQCDVPVCDIPGTISTLEKGTSDTRATFLGELYQKTRGLSNVNSLKNLHEFSKLSYEVQKKAQDPDNVLAWSVFLRESSISGLFKFEQFELNEFKALYQETFDIPDLAIDRQVRVRFDVYQRWRAQINTIMDVKAIYDLYAFISFAQQLSDTNKDEDYVIREAVGILDLLGKRLSYLYPSYEGVFEIKTFCNPDAASCAVPDLSVDHVTLLNSITDMGIFSGYYNTKDNFQSYMFARATLEKFGTKVYSASDLISTNGRPSESYVLLDNAQNAKGYIVSSRYSGSLHFEGKVVYTPIKFYTDEGLENQKPVITGKFTGTFGDKKAVMIIRQKKNLALMATMLAGTDNDGLLFDFTNGEYVAHRGLINLVGFPSQKLEPFKLNIAYRKDAKGNYRWTGGYFTISGHYMQVEFTRTNDIDLPSPDDATIIPKFLRFN